MKVKELVNLIRESEWSIYDSKQNKEIVKNSYTIFEIYKFSKIENEEVKSISRVNNKIVIYISIGTKSED